MKRILFYFLSLNIAACSSADDNVPQTNLECEAVSEVLEDAAFNAIQEVNYTFIDIQLNVNCLEVSIGASGCDTESWGMNLYSTDSFFTVFPLQRQVKFELINGQACLAYFEETISFDLTPFQIEGQNEVPLQIEGWDEALLYVY